jgi:hypothetical protein
MPNTPHEDQVFKVIDNILKQVFGEKAAQTIYNYLETHYGLRQCEFCQKIDVFAKGLESFLCSSAPLLERKILGDIYATYGLPQKIDFPALRELGFAMK